MTGGVSGYGKVQWKTLRVSTGDGSGVRLLVRSGRGHYESVLVTGGVSG